MTAAAGTTLATTSRASDPKVADGSARRGDLSLIFHCKRFFFFCFGRYYTYTPGMP